MRREAHDEEAIKRRDVCGDTPTDRVKGLVLSMHAQAAELTQEDRELAKLVRRSADDLWDAVERLIQTRHGKRG